MEINEIFEKHIKIESKVMSIETLFNNPNRVEKTNYEPFYQRNYVWDNEKATYFIESILLGTEIPPLIFFSNDDNIEVIDGRQRYQTTLRFIKNEFKLSKGGLLKFGNLAKKSFRDLNDELKDTFWDTKLRIIVFSFHNQETINSEMEDIVKKEIFKRYNSGITPLTPTEIDKATYFYDDLNSFIKDKLQTDKRLYDEIASLFYFEKNNSEKMLRKIRQISVIHKIPIRHYAVKKEASIIKEFELLSDALDNEDISSFYNEFIEKINVLLRIKKEFKRIKFEPNRFMFECIFWSMSIAKNEKIDFKVFNNQFVEQLVEFISKNSSLYNAQRSSFVKEIEDRYKNIADFFSEHINIDFFPYLQITENFKIKDKENNTVKNVGDISFEDLRINKPEPSSITIEDITIQMNRQRFLIRPPYQRNEVINKKKSSSIIESILLGIKIPPIFVFKREDGISEVLDGQQRLLSLLGFIQKPYLDENKKLAKSDKDGYALSLKNGILSSLDGKRYVDLSPKQQKAIQEFDLWIIEISQRNNKNFEPTDLFIRLNNKPYPIKENTFEMWNSYIDREIIELIKSVYKKHKNWFYFRKNNSRMDDENIYTFLAYLQFRKNSINNTPSDLDIYKIGDRINFRIKSKIEISRILENPKRKKDFIKGCNDFENVFIEKLKFLLIGENTNNIDILNKNIEQLFGTERRRTQQSFYALWYFLTNISYQSISKSRKEILSDLKKLFELMDAVVSKIDFETAVNNFWSKY